MFHAGLISKKALHFRQEFGLRMDTATSPLSATDKARPGPGSGVLIAIVGPSGAGKDTLMNAARAELAGEQRFVFVRRVITRPAEAGGEEHLPCGAEAFAAQESAGAFALSWQAHGLSYGIPASVHDEIDRGRIVIVNLSRKAISEAEEQFLRLAIIEISAPVAVLAQRLAARGRETEAEIAGRLSREAPLTARHAPVHRISNDRAVNIVAAEFIALLREIGG